MTPRTLLFLSIISLFGNHLMGQEEKDSEFKIGLGASLFNIADYEWDYESSRSNDIYITIDLNDKFRIEPSIGFALSNYTESFSAGIGGFGKSMISDFNLLYGLRLAYNSNEILTVAPTVAGEYYFIKHFSIGCEVQLRGLIYEGELAAYTRSSLLVRFYF
ncbi:hypothetical protein N9O13_02385 [Crocinitomicaceae bacterium]|nr:hypothetical protein [Crocinitomicaceae bacterium]MDC1244956.1 hypothetical protein [Crocinitomicaceae bacterium]